MNQVVYSYFRDSKAKKSYENSLKIEKFVPKAIGYIEFYKYLFFKDSYFISENFSYDYTIREALVEENFEDKINVFKSFAKFTFELHNEGIYHLDYSPGNILIKKENDNYIFKIVDINRMLFKTLSLDEKLKNFSKLWAKDKDLEIILKEYSILSNEDEIECLKIGLDYSIKHKNRINAKKRRRGQAVVD